MNAEQFMLCFVFLFLIAAISCQPVTDIETGPIPSFSPTLTQQPTALPTPPNSNLDNLTQLAIADLAQRLKLDPNLVTVIEAEPVTWPDSSLGCPQSGMTYLQANRPGFRVILMVSRKLYEYHTDVSRFVMLCEKDNASTVVPPNTLTILRAEVVETPVSGDLERLIDTAKEDLAQRLGTNFDEIEVLRIEKAEWPDTSLGCAQPGLARRPVAIPGYRIILSAGDWEYVYHTNKGSGVVYCPKG